jgi:hypothetical protein
MAVTGWSVAQEAHNDQRRVRELGAASEEHLTGREESI